MIHLCSWFAWMHLICRYPSSAKLFKSRTRGYDIAMTLSVTRKSTYEKKRTPLLIKCAQGTHPGTHIDRDIPDVRLVSTCVTQLEIILQHLLTM